MPLRDVVCLANSRKLRGTCVAGLATDGTGWVRPIGRSATQELAWDERQLDDASEPQPFDVVRMDLDGWEPTEHQRENWRIGRHRWVLVQRPASQTLSGLIRDAVTQSPPFGDARDRVPVDERPQGSLQLIRPLGLEWQVRATLYGKKQIRALFAVGGDRCNLVVTDPVVERRMEPYGPGVWPFEFAGLNSRHGVLLTVSLGERFEGCYFKLVAAVLCPPWRV